MKLVSLFCILVLSLASCAAPPIVGPRPTAAPVKAANEATRKSVRAAREEIAISHVSAKEGKDALKEADSLLPGGKPKTLVELAISKWDESETHVALADRRAQEAEDHALVTDHRADMLQGEVDKHYLNEQKLSSQVNTYKPFWDKAHSMWGIGAIGLGIGILSKHLLIALAILAVAGILIAIFAPGVIGVIRTFFGVAMSWIKDIIGRFKK